MAQQQSSILKSAISEYEEMSLEIGCKMHDFAKELWPIHRTLACEGTRTTLRMIKEKLPALEIHEIASGTEVFDWRIPKEWNVRNAWLKAPDGRKLCDFQVNNLHLVGYSTPISTRLSLAELNQHLHSLPLQPDAVPYVTSYYNESWGFCISHNDRMALQEGEYEVFIDADLTNGHLNYGELVIEGKSKEEVLISTYVCHPSMANNELSGPVVATFLALFVQAMTNRRFTYKFVFIPETIGSIAYLSRNLQHLKANVVAGFNLTCMGDDRTYSFLPSRNGKTMSDEIAKHVLKHIAPDYRKYSWLDRGSDERQYCAPRVDLPIATIMRSKYGEYPEYHTSLDNLEQVVTPKGLAGGLHAMTRAVEALEWNVYPRMRIFCEPQLSKRGLYPTLSGKSQKKEVRDMMNIISYCDGQHALLAISEMCRVPIWDCHRTIRMLAEHEILDVSDDPWTDERSQHNRLVP